MKMMTVSGLVLIVLPPATAPRWMSSPGRALTAFTQIYLGCVVIRGSVDTAGDGGGDGGGEGCDDVDGYASGDDLGKLAARR